MKSKQEERTNVLMGDHSFLMASKIVVRKMLVFVSAWCRRELERETQRMATQAERAWRNEFLVTLIQK